MQIALTELAALLGHSRRVRNVTVRGVSIDSRTMEAGQVFFAIRGPRFDGHDFVGQALGKGAAAAVVDKGFFDRAEAKVRANLIPVRDTVLAIQQLARGIRRRWGKKVVAVTGSTGKTTTKELIAALLGTTLKVLKSPGNLNNQYGLPLALLQVEPSDEAAVLELAMSGPGELRRLAQVAEPEIGVVTNVAPVHLEFFDSVDGIASAKRELIENLSAPGAAVLNFDDPRVRAFRNGFNGQVLTFGFEKGADLRAVELTSAGSAGSQFQLESRTLGGEFQLPLPGKHNVMNALAALAAASLFDIPENGCRQALAGFANLPQRSEILTLPHRITLINDSYNSNPLAMQSMLETLASWPAARRIVVAGEMLELGPTSPDWHRELGRKVGDAGVDWLLAVQGDARCFLEGAAEKGLPLEHMRFFPSAEAVSEFLAELVQPGDVVLLKASRGVHLEKAVEFLKLREKAEVLLPREASSL